MAFWKFTGSSSEVLSSHGIVARPGYVYDFGTDSPPDEPITTPYAPTPRPRANWVSDAGPATDFLIYQASDMAGTTGVVSVDGQTGVVDLSGVYSPGGSAGNINKATAQGVALVQALIFGS